MTPDPSLDEIKSRDQEIIGRYVALKKDGKNWKGLCPFHSEKTPSFHYFGAGKGFMCFGCGKGGDVFRFVELIEGLDFAAAKRRIEESLSLAPASTQDAPARSKRSRGASKPAQALHGSLNGHPDPPAAAPIEPLPEPPADAPPSPAARLEFVESYPYVDETGSTLYEVHRFKRVLPDGSLDRKPKEFRQRRPDGAGGWSWGLDKAARRPLYRLPAVLEAPAVYVVEGEKDVHTLERLGRVATTNSGGSSTPWREEWTEALRGKTVVIIPDADKAGQEHGRKVFDALYGAAAEVAILRLPEGHKDVTDWVAAGGTAEELGRLTREAITAARNAPTPRQQRLVEIFDRIPKLLDLKTQARETEWLVEDLLPAGAVVLMAGSFGSYKSSIARHLGIAAATADRFGSHVATTPRPVLYLDRENPVRLIGLRVRDLALVESDFLHNFRYWPAELEANGLEVPALGSDVLIDWAAEYRGLIVFDSLVRFHRAQEKDNTEMAKVMADFTKLARAGATCLVIHHRGKNKEAQYRGAEDIMAAADVGYTVQRNPDGDPAPESQYLVEMEAIKNRFAMERKRRFILFDGRWESAETRIQPPSDAKPAKREPRRERRKDSAEEDDDAPNWLV